LDKINVHKLYNLQFSTTIGPHVYDEFMKHNQEKTNEKIMQCPFIKSPPL
jgi:hypothetical protein